MTEKLFEWLFILFKGNYTVGILIFLIGLSLTSMKFHWYKCYFIGTI